MMFIDFGANDPNVDISSVQFESVNAIIVDKTTRFVDNINLETKIDFVINKSSRYLILRHREYNNDITDVRKIDLQGRSYDPTESHKLGSFSRKLHNMAHFRFIVSGFLFPVITNRSPIY